ncbi:hypothetical protein [Actinomadura flavalba]|uniref:carboxylate--amine ligase n=1 Tax=Actinomadura flavalba TaxID=1120938 RepID=UPI00036DF10F|nr:hypothetical protein [Actinomadura flavalba]
MVPSVPDLDTGLPVVLLRTDPNPFHHGTLGAIRSLGRRGVAVHAALAGRTEPVAASRHLRAAHTGWPGPDEPAALRQRLAGLAHRIGARPLLVPLDDAGAIYAAENSAELAQWYVLPPQDPDAPRRVADKDALTAACERRGIPVPETHRPTNRDELRDAVAALGLPLVAKWSRPWLLPSGSRSTWLVRTVAEARALPVGADGPGGPLLLQRLVPSGGGDWFFHGYFDGDGRCLFGATGRKHVSYPDDTGHTVAGEWVDRPELAEQACRLVGALGYRGVVDLDLRFDPGAGVYRLLDFNPRLGAQFRLFEDARGLDLVRTLHLDASGRPVPPVAPRYGRTLLVENQFLRRTLGSRGAVARFRDLAATGDLAWYDRGDLGPFLAMGRHSLTRVAGRALVRARAGAGTKGER